MGGGSGSAKGLFGLNFDSESQNENEGASEVEYDEIINSENNLNQSWTGLPKEEKLLELVSKTSLKEFSSGLIPFYTIDYFKFKVN